jgi:hypothetical protein
MELARHERDALLNWPARIAPILAGAVGCDQIELAVCLEKHVRQYLSERADPPALDLKSGRARR